MSPGGIPNIPLDPGQVPTITPFSDEPFPTGGTVNPFGDEPLPIGTDGTAESSNGGILSQTSNPSSSTSAGGSTSISNRTTGSSTSTSPSIPTSITKSTSHNKNALIGGVVGGIVALLIITAFLTYYLIRRSRRGKKHDPDHVTAFEVSTDKDIDPRRSHSKPDPHPPAPNINQLSAPGSSLVPQIPIDVQQKIGESANHSSPDITIPQRDSAIDQSMSYPNRSSPELLRSNLPIISHNPTNLNPWLQEIINVTQGRNQGPSDTGDPNVPQNIQIFIINHPSNTDGSAANESGENRGVYYGRSSPRNMDIDTLSLPPSYE